MATYSIQIVNAGTRGWVRKRPVVCGRGWRDTEPFYKQEFPYDNRWWAEDDEQVIAKIKQYVLGDEATKHRISEERDARTITFVTDGKGNEV